MFLTLENTVLRKESTACHEVDATAYDVTSSKGRSVNFPSTLTAERLPVISVIRPAL